ncbi:MAG: alpha/beta hydrolase family protein [Rhodospirillales bacterium]
MLNHPFAVYRASLAAKLRRLLRGAHDPYLPLPEGTRLSPSLGIAAAYAAAPRKLSFETVADPRAWQTAARAKLAEITGYHADRDRPVVTREEPQVPLGGGLVRRSFYLRIRPETDLPVHLVYREPMPDAAPIYLHLAGSTSGVHLAWGDTRLPIDHERIRIGADMARQAAGRGYVAVAIEQAGYGERGERALAKRSGNATIDTANHLLLLGRTLMGDGASDVSSAIDWLLSVDSPVPADDERLFLFGHSAGGTLAQFAAALDTRIRGVLASGSVGPVRETIGARASGTGHGIVPGFLTWFDTPDLIALVAPRPYIGLSGTGDHIFPFAGVEKAVAAARPFYERLDAAGALHAVAAEGKHQYHPGPSWAAWEQWIDPANSR